MGLLDLAVKGQVTPEVKYCQIGPIKSTVVRSRPLNRDVGNNLCKDM